VSLGLFIVIAVFGWVIAFFVGERKKESTAERVLARVLAESERRGLPASEPNRRALPTRETWELANVQ
jgi:hypothetical protein